ncbi:hypothetical protein A3712_24390 [Vibrio sp. HI00D65]|uniref:relaxase/mobilization nuclease domain-containing protein n=4 Tax=Vibrio sp. HI00D65 TaxID=1822216 RepID=UPI0007B9702E|nr:DNA-primase RepB domain-containing protein [Vibrio sp. HI00D65]KZX61912.1 hypothetical protein A3712_24390 [Vibrio sp. HI00D65]
MKASVNRGDGFRGVLNYVFDEGKDRTGDKKPEVVAGNVSGRGARDLAREFSVSRALRDNVKSPVWHTSLSLPEGEKLDSGRWDRAVNLFLKEMSLDTSKHQFVAVRHNDTDKDHVHIIASRIGLDGSLWHGRKDVFNAIEATQVIERELDLTLTAGYFELDKNGNKTKRKTPRKQAKQKEIQMSARTGEAPQRLILQKIIDEAIKAKVSVFDFIQQLEVAGVTVRPNVAKTGRLNGFSFVLGGIPFKGSDLGDNYKWSKDSKLKQNIIYEQDKDGGKLIAESERIKQAISAESSKEATADQERKPTSQSITNEDSNKSIDTSGRPSQGSKQNDSGNSGVTRANGEDSTSDSSSDKHDRIRSNENGRNVSGSNAGARQKQAQKQLEKQYSVARSGFNKWSDTDNHISDLAAPSSSNSNSAKQSPDQLKKIEAWRRQHEILGADSYRITVVSRSGSKPWNIGKNQGEKGKERFYTAEEVEAKIPFLRQKNARGGDIYITPISSKYHFAVIDDVREKTHMMLVSDGFKPTLVQESSKDNRQLIFKLPKEAGAQEAAAANKVVFDLNKKYGDPKFSGAVHPFRMAGFSNKKAGRNNAFTKIISRAKEACSRVSELLDEARGELAKQAKIREVKDFPQFAGDADTNFRREWAKQHGLAETMVKRGQWQTVDLSAIDYRATEHLVLSGLSVDRAIEIMSKNSPELASRKHDVNDYCARTSEKLKAKYGEKIEREPMIGGVKLPKSGGDSKVKPQSPRIKKGL